MKQVSTIAAGIDVAKEQLDVAVHGIKQAWRVPNTPDGFGGLVRLMRQHHVERIGLEASGGYERDLVEYLRAAGLTVIVLQPQQVRAYAVMKLRRAKTDRIDAELIAAFTAEYAVVRDAPDPRLAGLAERLTCLEQTEEDMVRLKVRLEHVRDADVKLGWKADLARLKQRRANMIAKLVSTLRSHDDLAARYALVLSVDGIGPRTALALLIRMPELGRLSRGEAASLAGLAPSTTIAASAFVSAPLLADERACAPVSMPPLCQRPSNGMLPARPSTPAFEKQANLTSWPSWPAPESSSSLPMPSLPAVRLGPNRQPPPNGCST